MLTQCNVLSLLHLDRGRISSVGSVLQTAEREVAGSVPGAGPLLRVTLRNEGTSFALQAAGPGATWMTT